METAVLGGGCFWCLEAAFEQVEGVEQALSGYSGGHKANPTYAEVCKGATGHAEVVRLDFDPKVISYRQLLEIFFGIHDPTTRNRQGNDVGSQYRSVIFYQSPEQQSCALDLISELNARGIWSSPIVTEVASQSVFFLAEEYHQHYFRRNPGAGYCAAVIGPKVSKFRKSFAQRLKPEFR